MINEFRISSRQHPLVPQQTVEDDRLRLETNLEDTESPPLSHHLIKAFQQIFVLMTDSVLWAKPFVGAWHQTAERYHTRRGATTIPNHESDLGELKTFGSV